MLDLPTKLSQLSEKVFYWRKRQEIGQFDNNSKVERGLRNMIVSNKRWMLCRWERQHF